MAKIKLESEPEVWAELSDAEATPAAPAPTPPAAATLPVLPAAAAAVIEAWFVANVHNRELPVQLFNSLYQSKASLMQELANALAGKEG